MMNASRLAFCALAALTLALPARAATVFLEELTWTELRDALQAGRTTVLVPIGGTEQNGPHIALGKHNARSRLLAGRIAESLGDALVAPVMAYVPEGGIDPPAGHMRFPGTLSIPGDAFEKTVEGAARSLRRHGFTTIVLLGDHGGYQPALKRIAARLDKAWAAEKVRVLIPPEYYRDYEHAGPEDTALSWATVPQLVRTDRLPAPAAGQGFRGDPRAARVDDGRKVADEIVRGTAQSIRRATASR